MKEKRRFQLKNLIVTALMVLCSQILYRVLSFLFISPYTLLFAIPIWAIIGAIAYFLVPTKTKNPWMILLFCVLTSLIGFYPPYIISCITGGIAAMLIAKIKGIGDYIGLTVGYMIFCVLAGFGGMYVPFLFYAEQTITSYKELFGDEYLDILTKIVSPITTVIMLIVIAICAIIGAMISKKLLKKHFEKAGVI